MNRADKIATLKDLLAGTRSLEAFKEPLRVSRLTVNEIHLLLTLNEAMQGREESDTEKECKEYYRAESNRRPLSREEERGYPHSTDADYPTLISGSDAKVREWYSRLELPIKYDLIHCEP